MGWLYLNSLTVSMIHQFGRASNGQIKVYSGHYIEEYLEDEEDTENYILLSDDFDALDIYDNIDDELEDFIFPDIYHAYDVVDEAEDNCYEINNSGLLELNQECNFYSITELKNRYKNIKQSIGIELKLYGFSFYSYPTAITYEYHIPISDPWNNRGQQYLKVLFDFK